MSCFWEKLDKPILALAPMAGITDSPFRRICSSFGADVLYSEMASAAAIFYGGDKTFSLLDFVRSEEKNYVVQIFGASPDHFAKAAKKISEEISPDGLDINFGCPVPKVARQGAGAALMKDFRLAKDCVKAVLDNTSLPVSIKTRTLVADKNVLDFLDFLDGLEIKALMIHGRSLSGGFAGPIDCKIIKEARKHFGGVILANGGINSLSEAMRILSESEADGLGLARGILGRPWLFEEIKERKEKTPDLEELKGIIVRHAKMVDGRGGSALFSEFRKHLCWYVSGLPGAAKLREKFVKVENINDVLSIISDVNN